MPIVRADEYFGDAPKIQSASDYFGEDTHPKKQTLKDIIRSVAKPYMEDGGSILPQATVSDIAPAIGSVVGGLGGAVSPVPGGAYIGGGLGYMAGKNFNRAIGIDPSNAISSIPSDASEAMLQEIGGNLVSRGVTRASNALTSKTVTPEMYARMRMYEDAGVPYTPADITQGKSLGLVESHLRKNIASANTAMDFDKMKYAALQDRANQVVNSFGGKTEPLEAGQIAQENMQKRYKQFMNMADTLYRQVPVDPAAPIATNTLKDIATGHMDELGKMDNASVKRILSLSQNSMTQPAQIGGQLTNINAPTYTWSQLNADKSALRKMAESTGDQNKKRVLYDLVSAINEDITKFADTSGNPEVKATLDAANKFYREGDASIPGVRVFRDRQIWNDIRTSSPEKIALSYLKPGNASSIGRLAQVAGPEGLAPIKASWLTKLTEQGEGNTFSPVKFASALDRYDNGTLQAFMSQSEIDGLRGLAKLSRSVGQVEKMAGNPSGTAQQGGIYAVASGLMNHPVLTTASLIGSNKFAKLYFNNPSFQKLLIEGSKLSPTSQQAWNIAGKLSSIAAMEGQNAQDGGNNGY